MLKKHPIGWEKHKMIIEKYSANSLKQLQNSLTNEYNSYRKGAISEIEYCARVKPIDEAIGKLEMATLQDTLALRGSSSLLSQKPES